MADQRAREGDGHGHVRHDPAVVAGAADRGGRLSGVLDACVDCRSLLRDLRAIAAAVPTSAIPPRTRDLRLTTEDAARLSRGGWRRLLAVIGTGRDAVTRPLALSLTTLGLAGLLLSAVPSALPFGDAASDLGGVGSMEHPLRTDGGDALPGQEGVQVPTVGPAVQGPVTEVEGAPMTPASDGVAVRILALVFLGLGLATASLRRVAATRRWMR